MSPSVALAKGYDGRYATGPVPMRSSGIVPGVEWAWLLLAFLVLVVLVVAFVFIQARRRAGGVIATRFRRQRRRP